MQALLAHIRAQFEYSRIVRMLVCALSDEHHRVSAAAIEALAVVHHRIGDEIQGLLVESGASVPARLMLAGRFASRDLPALKADGAIEHEVQLLMHVWLPCDKAEGGVLELLYWQD